MKQNTLATIAAKGRSPIIAFVTLVVCVTTLSPARAVENGGYADPSVPVTTQGARQLDFPRATVCDGGWIEWSRKDYAVQADTDGSSPGEVGKPPVKAIPPGSAPRKPKDGCCTYLRLNAQG